MSQASWFTRWGPLSSLIGALLTILGLFLPLIVTVPVPNTRISDPYPSTLDGVWLLRSLASQNSEFSRVSAYVPLLLTLALISLGTSSVMMRLQDNTPRVVNWIRMLAILGSLIVLLWFIVGVQRMDYVEAGLPPAWFSLGLGTAVLVVGIALSALGLGRIGIGAAVGAGISYLLFPFPIVIFYIIPIICLLGVLIGWRIQRASLKKTLTASS